MVGARVGDDAVPDDGLVGGVDLVGIGPLGSHVYEEGLGVPGEEGGEVRLHGELDNGVLLLLRGIVVRATLDAVQWVVSTRSASSR